MTFGKKLLKMRKERGLSQEELASRLSVSRQAVSRWEMDASLPETENIIQLSKLFGVSTDFLLNGEFDSDTQTPAVKETQDKMKSSHKKKMIILLSTISGAVGIAMTLLVEFPLNFLGIAFCCFSVGLIAGYAFRRVCYKWGHKRVAMCPMCGYTMAADERMCAYCEYKR